jgi:ATPase subunit of ABC transporter with duplicated ATPase domains
MPEEKKKSLFDKAIDALTDRDEKEAAAKAAAEKAEAEKVAAAKALADRAAATKLAAEKAAAEKVAAEKAVAKAATDKANAERIAAAAPKKGVVTVRSLRIRADHNTTSEVVAGLVDGNEVTILSTWSDGKNTWAKLDKGWAAMVYDGETYIKLV